MAKARITFLHPFEDGSGSALSAEMHYQTDSRPGFIRFRLASQKGTEFDFDNAMIFDMDVANLSKFLLVLHDEIVSIDDGKPIELGNVRFAAKRLDDGSGYAIAVVPKGDGESSERRYFVLKRYEAVGLAKSIEGAMFFISFIKGVTP